MRKRDNETKENRRRFLDRNYIVFILSLVIAVILWIGVSMFQTTEVDMTFQNIPVRVPFEGSMPANNGLELFGETEYTVDVTVSGKSYILNDSNFSSKLEAAVSLSNVRDAGTYTLPVIVTCSDTNVEITNVTRATVSLYFDETIERDYEVVEEIVEKEGYELPEGYTRENPRLSTDTVTLVGPSLEMGRIFSVRARVELDKELTGTESFQSEIMFYGSNSVLLTRSQVQNVTVKNEDGVTVTVPVSITTTLKPTVDFTGLPAYFRQHPVEFTTDPDMLTVIIPANDSDTFNAKEIKIGTIDFSEIDNVSRDYTFSLEGQNYTFREETKSVRVHIDMSSMAKRWLTVAVDLTDVTMPEGAELVTQSISSVQVIGPEASVMAQGIGNDEAYAVPQLDDVELHAGVNTVPVKIYLRTLTDSWVRGTYSVEIRVTE